MAVYEIPLTPAPQTFGITLGGIDYRLTLLYRDGWTVDIADGGGNPLVGGIPLVTGADLLEQFRHLGFQGGLFVQGAAGPDALPTFEDLGFGSKVYWVTRE